MKYFLDSEFFEDGKTIDPISVALVREDGVEFYKVIRGSLNLRFWDSKWHVENLVPGLPVKKTNPSHEWGWGNYTDLPDPAWINRAELKQAVLDFFGDDEKIEIFGYYADYDWVLFCQIFGRMIDLPRGFPMYCRDLKQIADERQLRLPELKNHQPEMIQHHALWDAREIRFRYDWLSGQ